MGTTKDEIADFQQWFFLSSLVLWLIGSTYKSYILAQKITKQ